MAAPNPGLLAAMLKANRLQGVVRWKVNFTESGFIGETNLAGWQGLWLDSSAVKAMQDFIDLAATESKNAQLIGSTLLELVNSLFSSESTQSKICIAWSGWQDLIKFAPEAAQEIADELDFACKESSAVVLVCDSVGSFSGISELSQG